MAKEQGREGGVEKQTMGRGCSDARGCLLLAPKESAPCWLFSNSFTLSGRCLCNCPLHVLYAVCTIAV